MSPILAASGVVTDDAGRFLLVQRRYPPEAGRWSVPGGRVEPGETMPQAVAREVLEETGIVVTVGVELWSLTVPTGDGETYEIHDFLATPAGGSLRAGDDASDARWCTVRQLRELPLTTDLLGYLTRAGLIRDQHETDEIQGSQQECE